MPPGRRSARGVRITDLADLSAAELRVLWTHMRGASPARNLSGRVMRLVLGWDLQATGQGGERPELRKAWRAIEKRRSAGATPKQAVSVARTGPVPEGTRIVRSWGGETHEILVTPEGALWKGETYSSLSAVARAMTGTRRNGPRFFGLREGGK